MTKFALSLAAAALASSAIMFSPVAYAETAKLSWQGLDLSTAAGQRELAHRTEVAARTACPDQIITGSHLQDSAVRECRDSVRAQVAQRIGASQRVALSR